MYVMATDACAPQNPAERSPPRVGGDAEQLCHLGIQQVGGTVWFATELDERLEDRRPTHLLSDRSCVLATSSIEGLVGQDPMERRFEPVDVAGSDGEAELARLDELGERVATRRDHGE